MRQAIVALSLLFVLACIPKHVMRRPATWQSKPEQRTTILNQATTILQAEGFIMDPVNEAAGSVKGELAGRGVYCGMVTCTATDKVTVLVLPNGTVRLDIIRTLFHDQNPRPAAYEPEVLLVEKEQARLLSLITGENIPPPSSEPTVSE